ncbi:MAG: CotH kinase family protein [Saprospirales bacterium]|nr:CotH kinase family protein [Saprospirales bacterium]
MKNFIILICLLLPLWSFSQVFSGTGGPISDNGTHSYFQLSVSGLPSVIDTSFGLEAACVNITHTNVSDLIISLISPNGKEVELSSRNGGDGDNYSNTCFNSQAPTPIYLGAAPFSAWYEPEGFLSLVNTGQDPNGIWTLHIFDAAPFSFSGNLTSWSLEFGPHPSVPFSFTHSQLPLVVISTEGVLIPDEPKIVAQMKVIDNGPGQSNFLTDTGNVYQGWIGIEVRGKSSSWQPKKSFSLETRHADSTGLEVSLLGMPEDEDWVLIGNFADKSLLRNFYAYHLYRKMGRWAPRMEFCELVIDGEYQGIYLLGERIKRGGDRVPIATISPEDTQGTELTGGYIFKLDWEDPGDIGWNSNYPAINASWALRYLLVYPKPENTQPAQVAYLKSYVDSFEYAMMSPNFADPVQGYRQFIDEASFVDYILLTELTKDIDGYRLSTYLHKDKNGEIVAGPPWDYDLSWGNANYANGYLTSGWNYQSQATYSNQLAFWWVKFFEDPQFKDDLKCRWLELKEDVLNPQQMKNEMDSLAAVLSVATSNNFKKWPILGIYVWPNTYPYPQTYLGEVTNLKNWASERITWLDTRWSGNCTIGTTEHPGSIPLRISPNPNSGTFFLEVPAGEEPGEVVLTDLSGRRIFQETLTSSPAQFSLNLVPGIYFLTYRNANGIQTERMVVE